MVAVQAILLVMAMVAIVRVERLELRLYSEERIKTEWNVLEKQL